jgi:nucleotide-binding universal stress UspA family protein
MYRKVLVPLDGSEMAECTLGEVKALVKDGFAGEINVLNIVKIDIPWAQMKNEANTGSFDINAVRDQAYASAKQYLVDLESRLASEGIKVKTAFVEANRPAETIVEYARKNGMDMIIIATHGHTGLKKMLLGSVASGVLNESHVPVLLIRPEACRL